MKKSLGMVLVVFALSSPVQADYMQSLLRGENEAALQEMQPLAQKGDAKAQYDYALMFETGLAVKQNQVEAASWYMKSAAQGYAYAQNNLAVMYEEGRGVERDYTKAAQWFTKAANQGLSKAQYSLGLLYAEGQGVKKDVVKAYMWLSLAASDKQEPVGQEKRDALAKTMTNVQVAQAQKLAAEFKPAKPAK